MKFKIEDLPIDLISKAFKYDAYGSISSLIDLTVDSIERSMNCKVETISKNQVIEIARRCLDLNSKNLLRSSRRMKVSALDKIVKSNDLAVSEYCYDDESLQYRFFSDAQNIDEYEDLKIVEELILTRKTDRIEIEIHQEDYQHQPIYQDSKEAIDLTTLLSSNLVFDRDRRTADFGKEEDKFRSEEIDDLVKRDMIIKPYQLEDDFYRFEDDFEDETDKDRYLLQKIVINTIENECRMNASLAILNLLKIEHYSLNLQALFDQVSEIALKNLSRFSDFDYVIKTNNQYTDYFSLDLQCYDSLLRRTFVSTILYIVSRYNYDLKDELVYLTDLKSNVNLENGQTLKLVVRDEYDRLMLKVAIADNNKYENSIDRKYVSINTEKSLGIRSYL